jgi:hypothetical protein
LRRGFHRKDGKIGADGLAVVTVYAQVGLLDLRGMISSVVEPPGSFQNPSRAIVDAVAAPLAPILYDMDHPPGYDDLFGIEGNSPEFHLLTSANIVCVIAETLSYRAISRASQDK